LVWPDNILTIRSLYDLEKEDIKSVDLLGGDEKIDWTVTNEGLTIEVPRDKPCKHAYTFKINGQIMVEDIVLLSNF